MYAKRPKIPMGVSVWMEKDIHIPKPTVSIGLMHNTTRYNVFLSRQFYSDMLDLSSERYRKLARFDFDKRNFLRKQRHKAETTMPGLLPYIEPFKDDLEKDARSCRFDSFSFPSIQSFTTRLISKSEPTFSQQRPWVKKNKSIKTCDRLPSSLERINRLAQPKGQRMKIPTIMRSKTIIAEDIFENFDNISNQKSFSFNQPKIATDDKRFLRLFSVFSEFNQRKSSDIQSVQNLIRLNPSLQYDTERWGEKNLPIMHIIEEENQTQILDDDSFNSQSDVYLVDSFM